MLGSTEHGTQVQTSHLLLSLSNTLTYLRAATDSSGKQGLMTEMLDFGWSERPYWDRKNWSSLEAYKEALKMSSTLYVGNLSFYTQESQIYALFDQVSQEGLIISGRVHPSPFAY